MLKSFKNYIENRQKGPGAKNEYINGNGKLVEKPKVKLVADYDGPDDKAPPKSDGGKGTPAPYKPANAAEKGKKGESGFADQGDSKLVYNPDLKGGDSKMTALGKELGSDWPKTKTESFIEKTRKMNSITFAQHILDECNCGNWENLPTVTAFESGAFHPHPVEAIRYVAALASRNDKLLSNLVFEMKRTGDLTRLLGTLLEHPEAYASLTQLFEGDAGSKRAKFFVRALNAQVDEAVGPPLGLNGDMDDEEEGGDMPPPEGDEEMPPEDGEGEEPPMDDEESMDDEHPEDEEAPEEEGDPMGDDPTLNPDDSGMNPPPPMMKKKAHHNLFGSMKNFESIKAIMKAYLS